MLHPRIPLRHLFASCKCTPLLPLHSYATVVRQPLQHAVEESVAADVTFAPPPIRDEGGFGIRKYKPRTPGVRHLRRPINDHLWKGRPHFPLTIPKKGHGLGGRNDSGHVTVRHRGGGHKRRLRLVDFARTDPGPHVVDRIEHDPGRTAHIALIVSKDTGKKSYIIAAEGMRAGDTVQSYRKGITDDLWKAMGGTMDPGVLAARTAWRGNCLPLHMIPVGTLIYNVGMTRGGGAIFCRSAGTYATVISKGEEAVQRYLLEDRTVENETKEVTQKKILTDEERKSKKAAQFVSIRLQSGEVRIIHKYACATVGVASNGFFKYTQLGKAGRKRWLGIRPTVRGLAMNAMDHPHGGGRGKSKGRVHPKSPWGLPVSCYQLCAISRMRV